MMFMRRMVNCGARELPADLKQYLGEDGWYLRDANWSPFFPKTAVQAAWFLEKEVGQKVDGVWAINLEVAKGCLKPPAGSIYRIITRKLPLRISLSGPNTIAK